MSFGESILKRRLTAANLPIVEVNFRCLSTMFYRCFVHGLVFFLLILFVNIILTRYFLFHLDFWTLILLTFLWRFGHQIWPRKFGWLTNHDLIFWCECERLLFEEDLHCGHRRWIRNFGQIGLIVLNNARWLLKTVLSEFRWLDYFLWTWYVDVIFDVNGLSFIIERLPDTFANWVDLMEFYYLSFSMLNIAFLAGVS